MILAAHELERLRRSFIMANTLPPEQIAALLASHQELTNQPQHTTPTNHTTLPTTVPTPHATPRPT
jgi:hypothetical protein